MFEKLLSDKHLMWIKNSISACQKYGSQCSLSRSKYGEDQCVIPIQKQHTERQCKTKSCMYKVSWPLELKGSNFAYDQYLYSKENQF